MIMPMQAFSIAESVEMGVEMVRVEWGKPPGLEKNYGRWPKRMEDDLWPLEDNHFGASFCITERSLLIDYMGKKYCDMIQFLYHGPFFIHLAWKRNLIFFTYPYNLNNRFPHMSAKDYTLIGLIDSWHNNNWI